MTYKSDFENDSGWAAADTNINLNSPRGLKFRSFLKENNVATVIRYYASSERPKTLTPAEARLLSSEGFNLLPIYQDRNRLPADFGRANGTRSARNALAFATRIGQPRGSTILFAVDADFSASETNEFIVPYFEAIKNEIGSSFRIGAYGGGYVLQRLLSLGLIEVPWISMSRGFTGTQQFFYSNDWFMRQVPPDRTHPSSGVTYDRNVLGRPVAQLGAFRVDADGTGEVVAMEAEDAILGGGPAAAAAAPSAAINAYVTTEGLNLRDAPGGQIIRELTIGQPVTDLGPAGVADWRNVLVDGTQGVVFGKYLRSPRSEELEAILRNVIGQWVRFNKGLGNEAVAPYYRYVGEMWSSIGESFDGRDRGVPWSAAFISYVVRNSGADYANFKFAAAHSLFTHDAIQARVQSLTNRPFWGYRRSEKRPDLGDIIVRNRGRNSYSYDFAENHSQYISHSDIVVEVTTHVARVIGGNVGDTVSMRTSGADDLQEYDLDQDGFLADGQKVIAVLKNRASEVA